MAKQFTATVNGNPFSFPSGEVRMMQIGGLAVVNYNGADYSTNETLAALLALANSGGTEQVQASILRVNDGVQTNIILMSFPASKMQIDNSSLSGSNSVINYNGVMYYAYETKSALVTAANAGGGGGGVTDITYADLVTAINANGLTAGQQYRITDYATKHYIVDANRTQYGTIITGVNEPLIVTASSTNTLESVTYSALHPDDIIYYDWNPANWLDDLSFSNTGVIVTGFKGVIYFRHDTLLDNYTGYDFRNCKFRRWKTNCTVWDADTSFSKNNFVVHSGFIYSSLTDSNTANTPAAGSDNWVQLMDLSKTEYYCNNPTSSNGILADTASFDDFKTFSEGTGSATYLVGVRSNHFSSFRDTNSNRDISATILSNIVIFLQDNGGYSSFSNTIFAESWANTIIGDFFAQNEIGYYFNNNIIGNSFSSNKIGGACNNNIVYRNCANNIVADNFTTNCLANNFSNNEIGYDYGSNLVNTDFVKNIIANLFGSSYIGNNFSKNIIGEFFNLAVVGNNFHLNTTDQLSVNGIDFTGATHVYANYNTKIFLRQDLTSKLSYCDNSDVIQVVDTNA